MDWLAVSFAIDGFLGAVGRTVPGHRRRWRPDQPSTVAALIGLSIVGATALLVPVLYIVPGAQRWLLLATMLPAYGAWVMSVVVLVRGPSDGDVVFGSWTIYRFGNWCFVLAMLGWLVVGMAVAIETIFDFLLWDFD